MTYADTAGDNGVVQGARSQILSCFGYLFHADAYHRHLFCRISAAELDTVHNFSLSFSLTYVDVCDKTSERLYTVQLAPRPGDVCLWSSLLVATLLDKRLTCRRETALYFV